MSLIYFLNRTLHVSERFSVHHQESSTVHTAVNIRHTGYKVSIVPIAMCTVLDS
jgi:hypothetical protein